MRQGKLHYAWVICFACMLSFMCVCGMITTSFSRYLPYIRDVVGLTNTQTELIMTIRSVSSMLTVLFVGKLYKRVSLRTGMSVSALGLVLSCLIFANAKGMAACVLGGAVMGVSYSCGSMYPISCILANWFKGGRSTALAIVTSGSGITSVFMPHVISGSFAAWGLSGAFYTEAVIVTVVAAIVYMLLRDRPEDKGTSQLSVRFGEGGRKRAERVESDGIKTGEFIALIIAVFMVGSGSLVGASSLSLLFSTAGFPDLTVSLAMSVFGVSMIIGKLVLGVFTDVAGAARAGIVFFLFAVVGSFMCVFIDPASGYMPVLISALIGLSTAMGMVGTNSWCSDLSSTEQYSETVRKTQLAFNIGSVIFSVVPGIIADITGTYNASYIIFGLQLLTAGLLIEILYIRRARLKR